MFIDTDMTTELAVVETALFQAGELRQNCDMFNDSLGEQLSLKDQIDIELRLAEMLLRVYLERNA